MENFDPRDMLRGAYIVQDFLELDERQPTLEKSRLSGLVLISTGSEGGATQQLRLNFSNLDPNSPCVDADEAMEYEDRASKITCFYRFISDFDRSW